MHQALILEELCDITDLHFCLNAGHMLATQKSSLSSQATELQN